jgi:hypothetical protein
MKTKIAIVVTSISSPTKTLRTLAQGCLERGYSFLVIGDIASPTDFQLEGCSFFDLKKQTETGFKFAELCPQKHYARKNLGYLIAARDGVSVIKETDDDNIPYDEFWHVGNAQQSVATLAKGGWINIYRYFSDARLWPRGFPLDQLTVEPPAFESLPITDVNCPIQQGLSDNDPDVDAIYRLTSELPQSFRKERRVALSENSWCPFNSQSTTWWRAALPLMYLPAYCSFRMTDIWRSFVAQRIAWTNDWSVLFHEPTDWQDRNDHNLLQDFKDEVPGYLHNAEICGVLEDLPLNHGVENIPDNLRVCYEKLVSMELIDRREMQLLEVWIADVVAIGY